MLLLLLACTEEPVEPVAFCEGAPTYDYAPDPDSSFTTFPDDHWTVDDPSTSTGLRVDFQPDSNPVLGDFPDNYANWFEGVSSLDGWGLTAGIYFRFTGGDLPELSDEDVVLAARTDEGWRWYTPDRVITDYGNTLLLEPRVALPSGSEVVAILLTDPDASDCIAPGGYLTELLDPEGRGVSEHALGPRFRTALEELDIAPERVAAMTVFTTQSAHEQSVAVAEVVADQDYAIEVDSCTEGSLRWCEGTLEVIDFRDPDRIVPAGPIEERDRYTLPVSLWTPLDEGPWPVIVCGHGLGGDRYDCEALIDEVTARGAAMVGIDAVEHGDHPARSEADLELIENLAIFAIDIDPPGLDGLRLRDNFRQSAWDKLQLIRALQQGVDLDGDGRVDLDPDRIAYAGVSLGAIMGPEPLALSDGLLGGWMAVGGARVTQIIQDSASFSVLIDLMKPSDYDDGDVERAFPLLQTMMDPGDPMIWAPHVQQDRWLGGSTPDIYVGAVLDDQVVPNSTNDNFARAFGAPGVGVQVWEAPDIDFAEGSVAGNGPDGASLGYVQHAVNTHGGVDYAAEHGDLHDSEQGIAAIEAFFEPRLMEGEPGTVLDPGE